jgi:excisionase family DNA binding protein
VLIASSHATEVSRRKSVDRAALDHDAWLTTREAADIIGCGERKLLRLIESGEIEAHRDGRAYLVSLTSVRAYRQSEMNSKGKQHANGEGSVYESPKGSGKWKAAITIKVDGKNKRIRRNASSQKDALKRKKELEQEFSRDRAADSSGTEQENPPVESHLVKEVCDEWLESISQANKENTLAGYKKALRLWSLPTIGDEHINQITLPSYPLQNHWVR